MLPAGPRGSGLPAPIHTKVGEEGKDGTKTVKSSWQIIELDERTIEFSDARMMEPASRPFDYCPPTQEGQQD